MGGDDEVFIYVMLKFEMNSRQYDLLDILYSRKIWEINYFYEREHDLFHSIVK
jgi:hypothetical protein